MTERDLHNAVCRYIRMQYPKARFKTDLSGAYLGHTNIQTKYDKANTSSHTGFPDIIIYELKATTADTYCGLALELKISEPYTKSGQLKASEHLQQQNQWLLHLSSIGFKAHFATGIDEAIALIDDYFTT